MKWYTFFAAMCFISVPSFAFAGEGDTAREKIQAHLKEASKVHRIPNSRSMVMFGPTGQAVVVTDNPRYVVKGELFDMWLNEELKSQKAVDESNQTIPLSKMSVNTVGLLDVVVNPEKLNTVTIFLDPFESGSGDVVRILRKYATNYRLRFILTTNQDKHVPALQRFACEVEKHNTEDVLSMIERQEFTNSSQSCIEQKVIKTLGLTGFLRIAKSPTIIASNERYVEALPANIMQWLADNKE
ncbi:hypothetical protein G6Z92_06405 [Vibrio aestuarianus subsp. cardii]|uniref:hypothetical protein n=1 Tax=Vibrio aestuarianus TaxID=28171 RepID=UPI0015C54C6C|nr:hypothetical protein [Vibrio aestuarianus]NGZ66617.1 hypothetical protein [Vibrio aestuarianus subsp. cardii]